MRSTPPLLIRLSEYGRLCLRDFSDRPMCGLEADRRAKHELSHVVYLVAILVFLP